MKTAPQGSLSLIGAHRLIRSALWNYAGAFAPMLLAIFAMPFLLHAMGAARFGLLAIAWTLVGYFALFDFGLAPALTKMASEKIGAGEEHQVAPLVWTALLSGLGFGLVGMSALLAACPWLAEHALRIAPQLRREALDAFRLLSLSLPIIIGTACARGALAAYQRFDLISLVRGPVTICSTLLMVAVLPYSHSLVAMAGVLLFTRTAGFVMSLYFSLRVVPAMSERISFAGEKLVVMLRLGGWMTVDSVIVPLMTRIDRFVLGAMTSMAAVAYFATPYEVTGRLQQIPFLFSNVMFPAFANSLGGARDHAGALLDRAGKAVFVVMLPAAFILVMFGDQLITFWLGADFAVHSAPLLRWLAASALFDGLALMPYALVMAAHRADLNAKLHALELPLYLVALPLLVKKGGIEGAALALALRSAFDLIGHLAIAQHILPEVAPAASRYLGLAGIAMATLALAALPMDVTVRICIGAAALPAFALFSWIVLLGRVERDFVKSYLGGLVSAQ